MRFRIAAGLACTGLLAGATMAGAASGPSLNDTLQFIRDKVAADNVAVYASRVRDTRTNQTWGNDFRIEMSNVTFDPQTCLVSFHWHTMVNGETKQDFDSGIPFGQVQGVRVLSMVDEIREVDAAAGHPTWVSQITPPIWVLVAKRSDGKVNTLNFHDRSMAERVSKAISHAAELCGGAKREPF
jgi:hypothetical protein